MEFLSYLASFVLPAAPPPERSILGVSVEQNASYRKTQEDFHHSDLSFGGTSPSSSGVPRCCFLGVYDGHGGAEVAEYVSKKLHTRVLDCMGVMRLEEEKARAEAGLATGLAAGAARVDGSTGSDEGGGADVDVEGGDGGDWTAALKYAYDQIDNDMADDDLEFPTDCGTTVSSLFRLCDDSGLGTRANS